MFARFVEITTRPGKSAEATRTVTEKVLPILKNYPGFVDVMSFASTTHPNRFVAVSLWNTQQDAERYSNESFTKVRQLIADVIEGVPSVSTYTVQYSTAHKIAASTAA
jgi:heme-degrading monooxygenase HmoA